MDRVPFLCGISQHAQVRPVFSTILSCSGDMGGGVATVLMGDLKRVVVAPVDHLAKLLDLVNTVILSQDCRLTCLVLLRGNNLTAMLQTEVGRIKSGKI